MKFHFAARTRRSTQSTAMIAWVVATSFAASAWAEDAAVTPPAKAPTKGIEEVIVTAERTSNNIQDVPIAVTAYTGATLQNRQILGTSDIQMNAPNVSFTPTNFGSSSLSIRGIGRLVTAGSGDAGVAIHMNEVPFGTNLTAMEFYDMERVEILRGPQGTLYGRNATGGVMNMITAKPNFDGFAANVEAEYGNYNDERVKGMINLPITDTFALRFAGQGLMRDGYTDNKYKAPGIDDNVDGRGMYSYRISGLWDITDKLSASLIYSKFHEDDNRTRITNQVCVTNPLPTTGCVPNAYGLQRVNYGSTTGGIFFGLTGAVPIGDPNPPGITRPKLGIRDMFTDFNPKYYYDENILESNVTYQFDKFTVKWLSGMQDTSFRSLQDYNMDVGPTLNKTAANPSGIYPTSSLVGGLQHSPCGAVEDGNYGAIGGCIYSNPIAGGGTRSYSYDRSDSTSNYWTTELNLQSQFDGMWNFLLGTNYSQSRSSGDYFVIANSLDVVTAQGTPPPIPFPPLYPGQFDSTGQNPGYKTRDFAGFGELYFKPTETVKITAGLRYNRDYKEVQDRGLLFNALDINNGYLGGALGPDPVWLRTTEADYVLAGIIDPSVGGDAQLAHYYGIDSQTYANAATVAGVPGILGRLALVNSAVPIVPQVNEARNLTGSPHDATFKEYTGRFGVDWAVNDNSSLYAFYSHGYKPGGFNPPINPTFQSTTPFLFDSEQIDAFEVGSKNMLLDDHLQMNVAVFHYDYKGLQIASIQNNTAVNSNIDAKIYGMELESFFKPPGLENLSIDFTYSFLHTDIANNTYELDTGNRTQSDPSLILLKNIDPGSNTGVNYVAPIAQLTPVLVANAIASRCCDRPGTGTGCTVSERYPGVLQPQLPARERSGRQRWFAGKHERQQAAKYAAEQDQYRHFVCVRLQLRYCHAALLVLLAGQLVCARVQHQGRPDRFVVAAERVDQHRLVAQHVERQAVDSQHCGQG